MKRREVSKKLNNLNIILWRYFALFAIIITVILFVAFFFIINVSYYKTTYDRLSKAGQQIENYFQRYDEINLTRLEYYIQRVEEDGGIDIYVVGLDGSLLVYDDTTYAQEKDWKSFIGTINDKYLSEGENSVIYQEGDYVHYIASLRSETPLFVVISHRIDILHEIISTMTLYDLMLGTILLIIAFLISYFISKKIAMPLKKLTSTAQQMAKGNKDVKFIAVEYKEVEQLADTLNYANEEINKSERFQQELLANVSHDFKTPLTMIKAYASMIQEISGDNPEKRQKHLQVIIDETDRLTRLVNDVLSVSKLNAGIDNLSLKVFNLTDYLYGIISRFDYLRETQGYTFMIDISQDLYTCADEEKIGQVIYNLISNAINYTGSDKTIFISLKADIINNRTKLTVKDTGKGIKDEDLPNIWDRYYRVNESHLRAINGSGLGLNIVKTVLEKHSFDFGVESHIDKGTLFWIDFPTVDSQIDN